MRNCKEGHSTKSLSSCRWKPSQAERLGSVQPWFCQVSGCLKSFLGQRIYHGGRGNLGWAEEGRKCKECFLGLPGQVLPSRATEGALQGLRRAAGLLLLWSDYGCRESIEQPPGLAPFSLNSACVVLPPSFSWRCQALTKSSLSQSALCLLNRGKSLPLLCPLPTPPQHLVPLGAAQGWNWGPAFFKAQCSFPIKMLQVADDRNETKLV